jgi:hypothetical protein
VRPVLWMIEGARALGAGVHQGAGEVQGHALPVRIHPTRVGSDEECRVWCYGAYECVGNAGYTGRFTNRPNKKPVGAVRELPDEEPSGTGDLQGGSRTAPTRNR